VFTYIISKHHHDRCHRLISPENHRHNDVTKSVTQVHWTKHSSLTTSHCAEPDAVACCKAPHHTQLALNPFQIKPRQTLQPSLNCCYRADSYLLFHTWCRQEVVKSYIIIVCPCSAKHIAAQKDRHGSNCQGRTTLAPINNATPACAAPLKQPAAERLALRYADCCARAPAMLLQHAAAP
jgi:hypothetical protein